YWRMNAREQRLASDALWARIEPLLPIHVPPVHPLESHGKRIGNRKIPDGIIFLIRAGSQWKALEVNGIRRGSTVRGRFQEWIGPAYFRYHGKKPSRNTRAGIFLPTQDPVEGQDGLCRFAP
ncbi:MAG: transposase, partial [Verrucomicrobia bacterium]|nr:transposase [Verrucomicrobiota bacterium]